MDTTLRERLASLVTPELVSTLEEMYPLASAVPSPNDPERVIWMRVGERGVVDVLRAILSDARANNPETPILNHV